MYEVGIYFSGYSVSCCRGGEDQRYLPGGVTAVGQGEITHPQLVHGAERSQTAVDRVPAFNADKTGCLILFEGRHYICSVGALHISLEIGAPNYSKSHKITV